MKIRFYHWWAYKVFYYFWDPVFRAKPHLLQFMIDYMQGWQKQEMKKHDKN